MKYIFLIITQKSKITAKIEVFHIFGARMDALIQTDWLLDLGYWGLFLGTFIAGTIVSLSSELLIIGMLLAGGDPWLCLVAATAGNGSGALVTYLMGWFAKWEWLEKWFKVKEETLVKQKSKVYKYGVWGALLSWLPVVGQLFMVALGFYKIKPALTVVLTYTGCLCRFLVWTLLYIHYGDAFIEWILNLTGAGA
jgi:membrane protein YqaA with SNARE-associated domain